jgi:hypothetical protein
MTRRLVFVLLLGLATAAGAQTLPRLESGGKLPTDVPRIGSKDPIVLLSARGYKPVDYPGDKAVVMPKYADGKTILGALEKFYYIDGTQVGVKKYRLLVRKADKSRKITEYVGWVEERQLITDLEAILDPDTNIHQKAFIVNRPTALKGDKVKVSEVPVYLAPDEKATQDKPLRLLRQLFIWGDSEPGSELKGFYLVGTAATMLTWDDTKVIIGWVPKSRVCVWNTREAFVWHTASTLSGASPRRTNPALVYYTPERAHSAWTSKDFGSTKEKYLFRETFGVPDKAAATNEVPFLLLRWPRKPGQSLAEYKAERKKFEVSPDTEEKDKKDRKKKKTPLRHVGVYAGFRDASGTEIKSGGEIGKLQLQLNRIKKEASTLELLIVLDATSSMGAHGAVVADLLEELIKGSHEESAGLAKSSFRLAVSYYRDVNTDKVDPYDCVKAFPLKEFGPALAQEITRKLREEKFYKDGWDAPEQVFRGIYRSIETAHFKEYSRKVVILVGDMGNNTKWDKGKYKDAPTVDRIAALLNPEKRSPILFFPFQVNVDPEKIDGFKGLLPGEKEAAVAFKKEALAILAASKKLREKNLLAHPGIAAGKYFCTPKDKAELLRALRKPLALLMKQQAEIQKQVNDLSLGRFTAEIGPELKKILDLEGIKLEDLKKLEGAQVFETGFVWEKTPAGAPQIAQRVLVSEADLLQIIDGLGKLRTRDPSGGSLKSLILKLAGAVAGEKEVVADLLFGTLKGVTFKSDFLRQAVKTFEENKIAVEDRERLLLLREKLLDLSKGLRYKDDQYVKAEGKALKWGRKGDPDKLVGKLKRWFYLGNDDTTKWYWLDHDKEWP